MSEFAVGDKVSWTHVSHTGRNISMSLRKGVVVEIGPKFIRVKTSSGRVKDFAPANLRLEGQKTQITEFIEHMKDQP